MQVEAVPLLQLMQAKGIGSRSLARVLDRLEREQVTLREFVALEPEEMVRYDLKEEQARAIHANEVPATQTAELLDEHRVRTILRSSTEYPERVKSILGEQAPPVLFVAGAHGLLQQRGVGFCGARDASEQAIRSADQVSRALAKQKVLVVSGHAAGVDETAHRAALEVSGHTALVLPEGILRFRPRSAIAELITDENAVVISEFSPNLPWSVQNAMQRNRTICGLVQALIVIEAGTTGGTWEAALEAIRLGIPLFVLEYPKPAPTGEGNPLLLRKGGQPLSCRPGESPDLTRLLSSLDLPKTKSTKRQPSLFEPTSD